MARYETVPHGNEPHITEYTTTLSSSIEKTIIENCLLKNKKIYYLYFKKSFFINKFNIRAFITYCLLHHLETAWA